MFNRLSIGLVLAVSLLFTACTKDGMGSAEGSFLAGGPGAGGNGNGSTPQPGVITAGEWNDLRNWTFWTQLMDTVRWREMQGKWKFYPREPLQVVLLDNAGKPVVDATVLLRTPNGQVRWSSRTDNAGSAICMPILFEEHLQSSLSPTGLLVVARVNGTDYPLGNFPASRFLEHRFSFSASAQRTMDIMFVVDATGSMGDEISYLKTELYDVLQRAQGELPGMNLRMGSVFYRDEGDDYVTRPFNFTTKTGDLTEFIRKQNADGGGDFPEAVHSALEVAIRQQSWSTQAQGRLLFLILDAPPHEKESVIKSLQESIRRAAEMGIKVIPVTASGIDKETEFLMRFMAIATQGTYVFITNDSGIGNPHLSPTVGPYTVEFLNNLMVRLIKQYGK